jgi:hypothetical protein
MRQLKAIVFLHWCLIWAVLLVEWVFIETGFHQNGFSSKRVFIKTGFHQNGFSSKQVFIKTGFHQMACSLNAQFNLVFKTVSRISVALLHLKLLMLFLSFSDEEKKDFKRIDFRLNHPADWLKRS